MIIHRFKLTAILAYFKASLNVVRGLALAKIIIYYLGSDDYGLWISLLGVLSLSTIISIANFQLLGNQLNEAMHTSGDVVSIVAKAGSNLLLGAIMNIFICILFLAFANVGILISSAFIFLVVSHVFFLFGYRFLIRSYEPKGMIITKVKFELLAEILEILVLVVSVWWFSDLFYLILSLATIKFINFFIVSKSVNLPSFELGKVSFSEIKPDRGILSVMIGEKLYAEGFAWVLTFTSSFAFISSFSVYRSFINFGVMLSITYLMILLPKIQELSITREHNLYDKTLFKSYLISFSLLFFVILGVKLYGFQLLSFFVSIDSLEGGENMICLFGLVVGVQNAIAQLQKVLPNFRVIVFGIVVRLLAILGAVFSEDFSQMMVFCISAEYLGITFYLANEFGDLKRKLAMVLVLILYSGVVWGL